MLPSWHFFFLLGATQGFLCLWWFSGGYAPEISWNQWRGLFAVCYLGGYYGARIVSEWVAGQEGFLASFALAFSFGPMTFYGGALFGGGVGFVYCLILKLPSAKAFDLGVVALLGGLFWGRIGCFLNGDDYGVPSSFGLVIPRLGDGIKRLPIQLFESGTALGLFVLGVFLVQKKWLPPGRMGLMLGLLYASFRFALEFGRGDPRGTLFWESLSTSQGISMVILLVGGGGWLFLRKAA